MAAATDNIDFFNLFTLSLFDRLYAEFPTPTDIDVGALASDLVPSHLVNDDTWYRRVSSADHAVGFLKDEGFIAHKGTYLEGGKFLQVRLTSKGLAVLGDTPDSLETREPLISRIRKALAGGAKEAGSETVKQLVQQAFTSNIAVAHSIAAQLVR